MTGVQTCALPICKANTPFDDALPTIIDLFGLDKLNDTEKGILAGAYAASMKDIRDKYDKGSVEYRMYGSGNPLVMACVHLAGGRAGIGWTTTSHTGSPVPTSAIGAGCEQFNGYYDNTDVPKRIAALMGLALDAPAATTPAAAPSR